MVVPPAVVESHAQSLPADVLDHILERCGDIDNVVAMSHVCAWWRRLARDHPVFWRDVMLYSSAATLSPGEVQQFVDRLQIAAMRKHYSTVCITVSVVGVCPAIERTLLPVVAALMDRVAVLCLNLDAEYAELVQHLLTHTCPNIINLFLTFTGETVPNIVLAENLFRCQAPLLDQLYLNEVQLPARPIAALRNLTRLTLLSLKPLFISPSAVHSCCPKVATLTLSAPSLHMLPDSIPIEDSAKPHFEAVSLSADFSPHAFIQQWPALGSIIDLEVITATPEVTTAWLAGMSGPLYLCLLLTKAEEEWFGVGLVEETTGRYRRSRECFENYVNQQDLLNLYTNFPAESWTDRLTQVTISQTVWSHPIVPLWLPELRAVKQLVLVLDDPASFDSFQPTVALRLPALKRLIVTISRYQPAYKIHARDLHGAMATGLQAPWTVSSLGVCPGLTIAGQWDGARIRSVPPVFP